MKFTAKLILFVSLLLGPLLAENDERPYDRSLEPAKSFHEARDLVEAGQFKDAYAIHKRMFSDISSFRPNVFFLYVDNLTYDWHRAAKRYPPAMESLQRHRDMLERRLSELKKENQEPSIEERIDLQTVFAMNEWLDEDPRSADLFATIEEQYPELAERMYLFGRSALIRANRYSTVVRYEPDPKLIFMMASGGFEATVEARRDLEKMATRRFESSIISSMDAFQATGNPEKAEILRKLALDFLDSEKIRRYVSSPEGDEG